MSDSMDKKTICHVVQHLEIGGLESLVLAMCEHSDHSRYNFCVLCLKGYDPAYKNKLEAMGASVFLLERGEDSNFKYISRIQLFLKGLRVAIVHVHSGCFFYGIIGAFLSGVRGRIFTVHGMPIQRGIQIWLEDYIAAMLTHYVVSVSEEIEGNLLMRFPGIRDKSKLIINAIDTDVFKPRSEEEVVSFKRDLNLPSGKKVIGSVGRLEPVKNYQMLLHAFKLILNESPESVHLVLVGCGDEVEKLENLAKELGISEDVSFLGVRYDIQNILPVIDIFVLSSKSEGTSISLLEAQSCGIPAVVTRVGGNGKIVKNGFNGFLCEVDNIKEMCRYFKKMLDDKTLIDDMSANARANVMENYAIASMIEAYEMLYDSLV